ncbi:hypothetical protein [Nocardia sp. NPDC052566]|uniref:hypothetical protein n=1 Tax=Nocardia sp. NPDC052566 TaxID=3364330 RepID=UPI0037CB9B4A
MRLPENATRPSPVDVLLYRHAGLTAGAILHLRGTPPKLDDLRSHVAGRLDAVLALSVDMEGQGLSSRWVRRQPRLADHIHERQSTAEDGAHAVARELTRAPFPADGLRWDLTVVHGYAPGSYAIIFRTDHGLQDGGALAYTVETLFSEQPVERAQSSGVVRALHNPPSPTLRQTASAAALLTRTAAKTGLWPHPEYGYSERQSLQWAAVPTQALRDVARGHGGTTNDAYIASVARTVNQWVARHATHAPGAVLPLNMAVNFRRPIDAAIPGNMSLAARLVLPGHAAPRPDFLATTVRATATLKSPPHREALRRLMHRVPRRLMNLSIEPALAPDRGTIFCSHVTFHHPMHFRGDPVETIEPLVLLPLGAPAAAVLYTYRERSSALFVTDAALREMDTLHHTWQDEAQRVDDPGH